MNDLSTSTSPLEQTQTQQSELEKSVSLGGVGSALPPHLVSGTRQRHWSTGSQLSSSSSSGNSVDSLRERLEKSDYFVVRRKQLGLFGHKSRHGSLERSRKRSSSVNDGEDLFTSTKALRDSFKSVSFAHASSSAQDIRRGSAPDITNLSSSSPSIHIGNHSSSPSHQLFRSGSFSESEDYSNGRTSLIDKPRRGILKNSNSGSESSLNDGNLSSKENSVTIVKTHRTLALSKSSGNESGKSGSASPISLSRRNSKDKDDDDERLLVIKTITKKISRVDPTSPPESAFDQQVVSSSSGGEKSGGSRRTRYVMQKSSSLTTPRRKISNCREEDEDEIRNNTSEATIKNRKKKKSRDEQRERRLSANLNLKRKESDQEQLLNLNDDKYDPKLIAHNNCETMDGVVANNMNDDHHQENGEEGRRQKDETDLADKNEPEFDINSRMSTSGIDSSRSDEDLHLLLQYNTNVSLNKDDHDNICAPTNTSTTSECSETTNTPIINNSANDNISNNVKPKLLRYASVEDDDCYDCAEADDKISDIETSFSQSISNFNSYNFFDRRQSDSSFTESFKHLQPFNFDLEPIKEGKRERLYKVLVVGELGTGKTSVIKRYVHQFFSQHYRATIGVDFALKVLRWDPETVVRLQLWDIAGQERFGSMTRVYYKEAVGAFVVFDVTRAATLEAVPKWKADLDSKVVLPDGRPIPTVLLANKCDQPREGIAANKEKMNEFCQQQGFTSWFETSAKDNTNIDEAANFLVSKILEIDRWSQEPMGSDPEKLELGSNGKHRVGASSNCSC